MGEIVLDHFTKTFGNGVVAVDDLVLTIDEGEFMVLVGPSGSGGRQQRVAMGRAIVPEPQAFLRLAGDSISFGGLSVPLDRTRRPRFAEDGRVVLGIRPEALEDVQFAERGLPSIEVDVELLEELGSTHTSSSRSRPSRS